MKRETGFGWWSGRLTRRSGDGMRGDLGEERISSMAAATSSCSLPASRSHASAAAVPAPAPPPPPPPPPPLPLLPPPPPEPGVDRACRSTSEIGVLLPSIPFTRGTAWPKPASRRLSIYKKREIESVSTEARSVGNRLRTTQNKLRGFIIRPPHGFIIRPPLLTTNDVEKAAHLWL